MSQTPARARRDPATIARELYAAAAHLADLAKSFADGAIDPRALSSADALLIGAGRLIVELRQRGMTRELPEPLGE